MALNRSICGGIISILPIMLAIPIGYFISVGVGMAIADAGGRNAPQTSTADIIILAISAVFIVFMLILPSVFLLVFKQVDRAIAAAIIPLFFEFFTYLLLMPVIIDFLYWVIRHNFS